MGPDRLQGALQMHFTFPVQKGGQSLVVVVS
jgi:hypothetical protein